MPPGLISSAAPGRKAAPKAAPRRRAQPPAGPPPSAQPQPPPITATNLTAQSPPPAQAVTAVAHVEEENPASASEAIATQAAVVEQSQPEPVQPREPVQEASVEREERVESTHRALPTPASTQVPDPAPQTQNEVEQAADLAGDRSEGQSEAARNETSEHARTEITSQPVHDGQSTSNVTYVPPTSRAAVPATSLPGSPPKRPAADAPMVASQRPAKRTKRSSARSNATAQAVAQGEVTPATGTNQDDIPLESTEAQPEVQPKPKRKPAVRKKAVVPKKKVAAVTRTDADEEDAAQTVAGAGAAADAADGAQAEGEAEAEVESSEPSQPKQRRKPVRRKAKTPATVVEADEGGSVAPDLDVDVDDGGESSDPELHEIDPNAVSLWDLSYDARHGKQSERGKKMAEIDWDKVAQDRRDAANALVANFQREQQEAENRAAGIDVVPSVENATGTRDSQPPGEGDRATSQPTPAPAPANDDLGLGFMLDADGNIVADEATLTFTRDAAAQAAAHDSAPVEDVNDLTTQLNRTAYMNQNRRDPADRVPLWKWKSDPWSEDETDKFYDALRMFGTDFFIISKMFPPKTRRMIKAKFTREEKLDPVRMNAALTGKSIPMNLEVYSKATGRDVSVFEKYEGLEHVKQVIDEGMKEKEVALGRDAKREEKERERERKAEEKEKAKEERKKARKAKSKKGKAGMGGFGGGMGGGGPEEDVVAGAD